MDRRPEKAVPSSDFGAGRELKDGKAGLWENGVELVAGLAALHGAGGEGKGLARETFWGIQ